MSQQSPNSRADDFEPEAKDIKVRAIEIDDALDQLPAAQTGGAATAAAERPEYGPQRGRGGPGGGGPPHMRGGGEKAINFVPSLKRLLGYLKPERVTTIGAILIMAVSVVLNIVVPKILGKGTDIVFSGVIGLLVGQELTGRGIDPASVTKQDVLDLLAQNPDAAGDLMASLGDMLTTMEWAPGVGIDFHELAVIIGIAIGLVCLGALGSICAGWLITGIVQRTAYRMRAQVSAKLDKLPLKYYDGLPRGELLSRVTNDIDNIVMSLQQTLSQMVQAFLTVVGILILMLTISGVLTLVAVISIPVSVVVAALIMKRSQKRFAAMWKATGQLNGRVEEAYSGHTLVKVFGRQKEVAEAFQQRNEEMYEAAFKAQFISGMIMPIMGFIGNLVYVLVAVVGGLRVLSGQITLGDVQAFIQYSRQFTQPVNQLASMTNLLQSGVASAERVFQVLDTAEETPDGTAALPVPVKGLVEFDHVKFSYDPAKPLITDLDLVAQPGQTIAIVGPTGAGKTTLVNLLMRFYDVQAGAIRLDGVDTSTVPRAQLRDQMGMVLQDTWLFHGTVRENIAYGQPGATDEQVLAAAKASYVDRFVRSLPEGYDTVIDEDGSNVSVGEKQLLTIARAFVSDPSLLILDEATSSVDTRTEVLIQKAMGRLRQGRTSFVIAHRLSTIRDADLILVMEHGDIVEQGNHAELLAKKGAYYRLYQSQFTGAQEDEPAGAGGAAAAPAAMPPAGRGGRPAG